jgi:hypothetical protein
MSTALPLAPRLIRFYPSTRTIPRVLETYTSLWSQKLSSHSPASHAQLEYYYNLHLLQHNLLLNVRSHKLPILTEVSTRSIPLLRKPHLQSESTTSSNNGDRNDPKTRTLSLFSSIRLHFAQLYNIFITTSLFRHLNLASGGIV